VTDWANWTGLLLALLLPWCCGAVWVAALLRRSGRGNGFVALGHGYLAGLFLTTLVVRLWDLAGASLAFPGPATAMGAIMLAGVWVLLRSRGMPRADVVDERLPVWSGLLVAGLLGLLLWRHLSLLQELLARPLYAWDAWVNWAPKAIVWFHLGELVDYVNPHQWLYEPSPDVYTLGNWRASSYPETVPLILLWTMLGAGTPDGSLVYLPWALAPLALGLGLYGHLRLAGLGSLGAVLAVYLLLSQPYVNVHTALAGYADIWLTASFGLAVCALYEWRSHRCPAYGLLVLLLAALCAQLKNPGVVLGLILVLCTLWGARDWSRRTVLILTGGTLLLIAGALLIGVEVRLPYLGRIAIDGAHIEAGRFGEFELAFRGGPREFAITMLQMGNWHLLWYALPLAALLSLWRGARWRPPPAELLAALGALGFVLFVFMFTSHYRTAADFTSINRALMYTVPGLLFCAALAWRQVRPDTR